MIGFFKEYDDLTAYYPEEIVILNLYQNKGYGKDFLRDIALDRGAEHIDLISVNDEHHMHFYEGFGMYSAANLNVMGKHYSGPLGIISSHTGRNISRNKNAKCIRAGNQPY